MDTHAANRENRFSTQKLVGEMMQSRKSYIESAELQTQERVLKYFYSPTETLTIFEIGACEGENSVRYANFFPNAEIYAFEPLPDNIVLVNKNVKEYNKKNIKLITSCLSDKTGEVSFYVSEGNPENVEVGDWNFGNKSSSILPPEKTLEIHEWLKFKKEIKVPTDTLSNFCMQNKIDFIDFIHMDVQGAELMVLQGAENYIDKISMIWLEVEAVELYKGQPLKNDIEAFLKGNGFTKLVDTVYTEAGDQFWINTTFLKGRNALKTGIIRMYYYFKFKYKKIRRKLSK